MLLPCSPCCNPDFTAAVALRDWGVNANPANMSGWTQAYTPSNPGSVYWDYVAANLYPLHSSTTATASLSLPAYTSSWATAQVKVTFLASEVEVRVGISRGSVTLTVHYRKPIAYWPSFSTQGTYTFTASDVYSSTATNPYSDPNPITAADIGTIAIVIGYTAPVLGPSDYTIAFTAGIPTFSGLDATNYFGLNGTTVQVTYSGDGTASSSTAQFCQQDTTQTWCTRSTRITFQGLTGWMTVRGYGAWRWPSLGNICQGSCYTSNYPAVVPIAYPVWKVWGEPTGTLDTGTLAAPAHSYVYPGFPSNSHGSVRLVLSKV